MGKLSEEFINQFHSLPGETIKAKQQNLYKLLNQYKSPFHKSPEELKAASTNLEAHNHLEKIFRIDFLIYFKVFNKLNEEYLNGDEITLSKVAKQEWFFQEAFRNVDGEKFATEILPSMSYSLKLKTLNRLSVSEKRCDEIFDAVLKRYGLFLATVLLPKCSVDKITEVLKDNYIKLTVSQLKQLYNKDPNLIFTYFEERTKHEGDNTFMNNNPIFIYIAQRNPKMFAKLIEKHKFTIQLGARTTKNYIKSQKNEVLDKSEKYVNILKKAPLVRKVGKELNHLLFKPVSVDSELLNWSILLKYYPKNIQSNVFKSCYNSTYYCKFGENVDVITEDMLKVIRDPLERENIVKLKFKKDGEKLSYFKYMTAEYCLSEFKKRVNQTTVTERAELLEALTDCCVFNEDWDTLLKVCEMVAVRFKNDSRDIRFSFFRALTFGKEKENVLDKLSEQHWNFLMSVYAKAVSEDEWVYNRELVQLKYVDFLIQNNKPIDKAVKKFHDLIYELRYTYIWKKPEACRKILCEAMSLGHPKPDNDEDSENYDCFLVNSCRKFNKQYPEYFIDVSNCDRILESVKKVLQRTGGDNFHRFKGADYIFCTQKYSKKLKRLIKTYFENFKAFGYVRPCLWFLKYHPKIFLEHIDDIMNNFAEVPSLSESRFLNVIKKYSHLGIDKMFVEHFSSQLKEDSFEHKKELVKALTMLTPADRHLPLLKFYIPTSDTVDLDDEKVKDFYALQCEFVKYFHYLENPEAIVPTVFEFCRGDYLKSALSPLYSSVYKLPEKKLKPILEKLDENKAVSVKKHGVQLACSVLDVTSTINFLKNTSFLKPTLKYLARNPFDFVWEVAKIKLYNAEHEDLQVIKSLEKISLPLEYKSKYIELTWKLVNEHENLALQKILIKQVHKNVIKKLSPQFAFKVIEECIFKIQEANEFISNLLIHINDNNKYDIMTKILSNFRESCWNNKESNSTARNNLHSFIQTLLKTYMKPEIPVDKPFALEFYKLFISVFDTVEAFDEFVMVSFMKLKKESVENCGKFVIEINNDFVKTYGASVINSLAAVLNDSVISNMFQKEIEKIQLIHFAFKSKRCVDDYLLIIKLLPKIEPKFIESFKLYHKIITDLEQTTNVSVRLQFNLFLKSVKQKEDETIY